MYRLSQSVRGRTKFTRGVAQLTNDLAKLKQQRQELLRHIYEPFSKLEKDSPEYQKLAESGKVWEDYFQPGNSEQYGYVRLQHVRSYPIGVIEYSILNVIGIIKDTKRDRQPEGAYEATCWRRCSQTYCRILAPVCRD